MLEVLKNLPAGVIGFEAVGRIGSQDYDDVLEPAIEAAAEGGGVRLVYVFGERFEGYSAGAAWEDTKLGLATGRSFERTALVSDRDWVENLVKVVGWMMPGKVRHFPLGELADAIAWTSATD